LTIIALSLRLADHMARSLSDVVVSPTVAGLGQ